MSSVTARIEGLSREWPLGTDRRVVLGRVVGKGALSSVMRGVIEEGYGVKRPVAVKVFDGVPTEDIDRSIETLAEIARALAYVRHPNVLAHFDFGVAGGSSHPFFVMEFVDGCSLETLIESAVRDGQRLPLDVALYVAIEVCEALEGARIARSPEGARLRIVHGGPTPSDVLLSWHGEVKLADFGVTLAVRPASGIRSSQSVVKRIASLSPEVAAGGECDARSDVFAAGILLREMLLGPRFPPNTSVQTAADLARSGELSHGMFGPQLTPDLRNVLNRALDPNPLQRFAHAGAFAYQLRHLALTMGVGDARAFLRSLLPRMLDRRPPEEEVTESFTQNTNATRR